MGKPFDKAMKNENETGKWTNYDDLYLFYSYKKLTSFQSPLIIHCRWILSTYVLYSIF